MKEIEFKDTVEYKEIKQECYLEGILNKTAHFECYSDNIFTYSIMNNNVRHQFSVIAEEFYLSEMQVIELINLKRVKYFEHSIEIKDDGEFKRLNGMVFTIVG